MKTIRKIAAIVIKDDRFLVVRKKDKDIWTSLGGKPEGNETEEETLIRETKEELNCGIVIKKKLLDAEDKAVFEDAQVKLTFYLTELNGKPELIDNELGEFAFISKEYASEGIKLSPVLENRVIPLCIKEGILKW